MFFAFLETLIESVDFGKLAGAVGVLAGVPIIWALATGLAKRGVKDELKNLNDKLTNAVEDSRLAKQKLSAQDIDIATANQTIAFRDQTITELKLKLSELQRGSNDMLREGQRIYREVVALRLIRTEHMKLIEEHKSAQSHIAKLQDENLSGDEKLREVRGQLEQREKTLEAGERRMKRAMKLEGYLLRAKALQARPKFRPLTERKRPIISLLNLKGGVGKTTLTAHLGAALARKGYRVLLVDLDLQGSLTGLMLPPETINERFAAKKLIQNFFLRAAQVAKPLDTEVPAKIPTVPLTDYIVPVPLVIPPTTSGRQGSISIVPTSDSLAYAELNLTLGWLLKQGERDARFLLRKALHLIGPNRDFDIVLLDCPPLLNISCVNALAASDYLLIPTLLSQKAIERVPRLCHTVARPEFVTQVNSAMKVLGVVANRTYQSELTSKEKFLWQQASTSIKDTTGSTAKQFTCTIPQDAAIVATEEQYTHPKPGSRSETVFDALAEELLQELPDDCRHR
jgi:cellulose biosynthesis protein BcsQ